MLGFPSNDKSHYLPLHRSPRCLCNTLQIKLNLERVTVQHCPFNFQGVLSLGLPTPRTAFPLLTLYWLPVHHVGSHGVEHQQQV